MRWPFDRLRVFHATPLSAQIACQACAGESGAASLRPEQVASRSATHVYGYDLLDRLTSDTTGGQTHTWAYDEVGNRTSKTVPDVGTVTYTMASGNNRLSSWDADLDIPLTVSGTSSETIASPGTWGHYLVAVGDNMTTSPSIDGSSFSADLSIQEAGHQTIRVEFPDQAGNIGTDSTALIARVYSHADYTLDGAGCVTEIDMTAGDAGTKTWDLEWDLFYL